MWREHQLCRTIARGIGQEDPHAEECEDADWLVDVEDITPTIGLGQPAPEYRPKNGTRHYGHAPHRHRRSLPLLRIDVEQHGLRERDERRAECALKHPEQDDL